MSVVFVRATAGSKNPRRSSISSNNSETEKPFKVVDQRQMLKWLRTTQWANSPKGHLCYSSHTCYRSCTCI